MTVRPAQVSGSVGTRRQGGAEVDPVWIGISARDRHYEGVYSSVVQNEDLMT